MGHRDITPKDKKYKIKGKNNKDLELELSGNDDDFVVTEFDTDLASLKEKAPDLPSNTPAGNPIDWFACFAIYVKDNSKPDKKGGYANVGYTVSLNKTDVPEGKSLFAYFSNNLNPISYETKGKKISFTLSAGDPPIGTG